MKLSAVPKKSLAAAACAALLALWTVRNVVLWLSSYNPFFLGTSVRLSGQILNLISALLGIALLVWLVIPNNRRYRTGLKVLLGLVLAEAVVSKALPIVFGQVSISGSTALTWLALLLGSYVILLFGALTKKSTEKLAALARLIWLVWPLIDSMVNQWRFIGRTPQVPMNEHVKMTIQMAAMIILPALLWAAALYLHPVLERPMLQPLKDREGVIHHG